MSSGHAGIAFKCRIAAGCFQAPGCMMLVAHDVAESGCICKIGMNYYMRIDPRYPMQPKKRLEQYRNFLLDLAAQHPNPTHGFFGPDSMAWRINRENVLGLGAMRALLLQIAHPKVAQGVLVHSNYRAKPFQRAYSTFKAQQTIVFGTCDQAIETLVRMYARHLSVRGELPPNDRVGDRQYIATDSQLSFWVFATLIDTVFRTHTLLFQPMTQQEEKAFYEESRLFATLMGIDHLLVPQTVSQFHLRMESMLASVEIHITPAAQEIASSLLRLPLSIFLPGNSIVAAGMLPKKLRDQLGLRWNTVTQLLFSLIITLVRTTRFILPPRLRSTPAYWQALERTREASDR